MNIKSITKMAFQSILSNKMRTFLIMLGIIIGVFSVVVLISIGQGATSGVSDSISSMGSNIISVSIMGRRQRFYYRDLDGFENIEGVKSITPVQTTNATVKYDLETSSASIAGISLLVGGIGIMNIMLVTVTERTREIGIRKAIGAGRSNILIQFLIESSVMSGTGGIIGAISGVFAAAVISDFMGISYTINLPVILTAFSFSLAVGIFFGLYPANKASKLKPVDALMYE